MPRPARNDTHMIVPLDLMTEKLFSPALHDGGLRVVRVVRDLRTVLPQRRQNSRDAACRLRRAMTRTDT